MHFLTLVIGEDPDGQLAPYQENNLGTCPEEYLEFFDVEEDYRAHYETGRCDPPAGRAPGEPPRHAREVHPTFDAYMAAAYGPRDEKTGRYGDWWNPNSEYDWYEVGGRWAGHLILRPGRAGPPGSPGRADQARKGEVDFAAMAAECYRRLVSVWEEFERGGAAAGPGRRSVLIPEPITTRREFEAYARRRAPHAAPSALVYRGEWSGPWWAAGGPTVEAAERWDAGYSDLLASLPDDTLLTVVDCHV